MKTQNQMENNLNSLYYQTQQELEYVMKNVLTQELGEGYEDKLFSTYEDWEIFSSLDVTKKHLTNPLFSKVFLLTSPISEKDISIDLLKELYNNDYILSNTPFDLGDIFLSSFDIRECYNKINRIKYKNFR
jgi:hypothetical protein